MPNSVDRVEVFAGVQRRRRYTLEQKLAAVAEAAQPGMSISFVARRHGISPSLLFGWRRRMAEGGKEAVRADDEVVPSAEVRVLEKRIRELERVLGKKTMENEILREAVKLAHKKTDLAVAVVTRGGYAVRRVAEALQVSRSQLHERLSQGRKPRLRYVKSEDAELLEPIRRLVDERPTYGYRRIGALLNRERVAAGLSRINHKRMYRLMARHGLLLQRYTGKPPGRAHEGQIIAIKPNLRWTSDGLKSRVGTVRSYEWLLRSTAVIGRL